MTSPGRRQSRDELTALLMEQVEFLRASSERFDEGSVSEAKRIAAVIRTLVHNSGRTVSLLKQLGIQHQLKFVDSYDGFVPPNTGLPGTIVVRYDAGLARIALGDGTPRFDAPLADLPDEAKGPQPFRFWWNRQVLSDLQGNTFTRKQLVLFLAHKVGGVHVDPEMPASFNALSRFNSMGWGYQRTQQGVSLVVPAGPNDEPMGDPVPWNVRQMAFEVESTLGASPIAAGGSRKT